MNDEQKLLPQATSRGLITDDSQVPYQESASNFQQQIIPTTATKGPEVISQTPEENS
jgi:ABC-type multidrug transport system ATPase subunit